MFLRRNKQNLHIKINDLLFFLKKRWHTRIPIFGIYPVIPFQIFAYALGLANYSLGTTALHISMTLSFVRRRRISELSTRSDKVQYLCQFKCTSTGTPHWSHLLQGYIQNAILCPLRKASICPWACPPTSEGAT
jgi:hypothetical protein